MPRKPGRCTTRCSLPTLVDHPLIASLGLESLGLEVLALLIGVMVGTYSSIFIASPIMIYIYRMLERRAENNAGASA